MNKQKNSKQGFAMLAVAVGVALFASASVYVASKQGFDFGFGNDLGARIFTPAEADTNADLSASTDLNDIELDLNATSEIDLDADMAEIEAALADLDAELESGFESDLDFELE